TAFAILVDGLVYASWLFIVAIGLSLIFGVMKILNVAHGAFYAFGAYGAATLVGLYFEADLPVVGAFAAMLLAAVLIGLILGSILERGLLRRVYGRDEVIVVLVTYAVFLILEDVLRLIWGSDSYFAYQPYVALDNVIVGEMIISNYDLGLIALAALTAIGAWWGLNRTRWGKLLVAVIYDREMSTALGINVTAVFAITFIIGAVLGAFGGAFTAPKISVTPGLGVEVIVIAFAVVAIGGMGSVPGALIGSLIVGLCRAAAVHLLPEIELFVIYAVMALVLAFRPEGLFSRMQARKI
ncbi:MAG TPA: branched-chain amino acid ABC transporter permease, partial [Geminicoccaceae bacterium]|nr:branched-chain amino acid ABC transporter permease [Geminicoccaceae bacterium]